LPARHNDANLNRRRTTGHRDRNRQSHSRQEHPTGAAAVSQLTFTSNGKVRTVLFTAERLVDELKIRDAGQELLGVLNNREEDKILLDFRAVQFMSSSALGVLLRFYKRCKEVNVRVKLCNIAPDILQVFKITNLNKIFEIHKSQEEAIKAFAK
jgi:anti-sigma B factor antagonist